MVGADLAGGGLRRTVFTRVDLTGADLTHAYQAQLLRRAPHEPNGPWLVAPPTRRDPTGLSLASVSPVLSATHEPPARAALGELGIEYT